MSKANTQQVTRVKVTSSRGNVYEVREKYASDNNVSRIIREMSDDGFSKGEIAKDLGCRFQQVRNVLIDYAMMQARQRA